VFFYSCSKQGSSAGGFTMPPIPVEVATAKVQKVADQFEAVGTIEAIESISVVSEIDAAVVKLPFEEGRFIKKGDLIAQLDDSQLSAEVKRSEALFAQSQTNFNRIKSIVEQKAGTQQDLDDAVVALQVAEANLALAKARFSKTRITAPFDGMIGSRKVSIGTFLRIGQSITELANINEIRVTFSAPERFLSQLTRGAEVTVSSTVYNGYKVKGKIIVIEPVLDELTRNARIIARVSNPGQKFLPGMSANISATLSEHPNAVTIPNEAVFANGNQSFVFVVKSEGIVSRIPITLGLQLPDVVEVVHGLEPGMEVVKAGHQKLFEGAKIMAINASKIPTGK
jgi:membrane fusion protein (multidrug efflux system)